MQTLQHPGHAQQPCPRPKVVSPIMIELECIGGTRTVTGSKYVLRTSQATVLLDCGLFQGRRAESFERNRALPVDVAQLDAVILSHAHLDHSGALPLLWQHGYRGPIYATPATRDLCAPMLADSSAIQASDAAHIDKLIARGVDIAPVTPLYGTADVIGTLELMVGLPYHRKQVVAPGITATLLDAGHVLGSAVVVLDIVDGDQQMRLAFTGDLGHVRLPILRDPEVPTGVQCLITESTYGDRNHGPMSESIDTLATTIAATVARGGKVIIPTFSLERAQEVIFALKRLRADGRLPHVPVYVDSPLTVKITDVFRLHPECFSSEMVEQLRSDDSPFDFAGLQYVSSVEESKAIDALTGPAVILAGSGMCEGGRVLHHLRNGIEDARNTVLIVGFQAEHTLGRRLVEQRRDVRIFGVMHPRNAEVISLDGLSAHADRHDLLDFAQRVRNAGSVASPLRQIIVVHGEPAAQDAFAAMLRADGFANVVVPTPMQRIILATSHR